LLDIVEIVHETKIAGIVATNTTIDRSNLLTEQNEIETIGAGGLSGRPLTQRAGDVVRFLRKNLDEKVVIIGVGGIDKADDGLVRIREGADLIQIYTAFIYEGAAIIRQILSKQ
jgi:dihydroorotate dehydrogenase